MLQDVGGGMLEGERLGGGGARMVVISSYGNNARMVPRGAQVRKEPCRKVSRELEGSYATVRSARNR